MNHFFKVPPVATVIFLLFNIPGFSQTKFEEGYFIDNNGTRVDCLIKNADWRYNPVSFEYKTKTDDKSQSLTIKNVEEFGINTYSKYIRAIVNIDMSPGEENLDEVSDSAQPQWQVDTLFLKVILNGEASLFSYEGTTPIRYFYQINNGAINQLIYKSYRPQETENLYYNDAFHNQLLQNINCTNESAESIEQIRYEHNELKDYFIAYNRCKGKLIEDPVTKKKGKSFHLSILGGLDNTSLTDGFDPRYPGDPTADNLSFPKKNSFTGGIEAEIKLPFNNSKWAIPLEAGFHSYAAHADNLNNINLSPATADIDFSTIVFAGGMRRYFFVHNYGSVFINASATYDLFTNKEYSSNTGVSDLGSGLGYALGVGYKYRKAAVEFRYYSTQNIFPAYLLFESSLKTVSLFFKYEIF